MGMHKTRAAWPRLAAVMVSLAPLILGAATAAWAEGETAAPLSPPAAAEAVAPQAPMATTAPAAPSPSPAEAPAASAPAGVPPNAGAASAAPTAEPSAAAHQPMGIDASELPRNLSPWNMFQSADIVVKAVMIGLAFASLVTWTVWLAKSLELWLSKRALLRAFRSINGAMSLAEASQRLAAKRSIVGAYIDHAALELRLSSDIGDKAAINQRVASRIDGLSTAAGRHMNRGTGALATIGSTAPFVGLFGTVWGIMNSFIGISEAQTTNLAVVAPGIAEALLATAIGLVAAIPAVIIYNHFSRAISAYKAALNDAADEVMRIVSRDLDRGVRAVTAQAAE